MSSQAMSAKTFENKTEKADELISVLDVLVARSALREKQFLLCKWPFPNKTSQKEASSSEEAVNTRWLEEAVKNKWGNIC